MALKASKVGYKELLLEVLAQLELGSRDHDGQWDHWIKEIKAKIKKIEGK